MTTAIDLATTVERVEGHHSAALGDGETALLGADLDTYFGLNRVASRVWELTASPTAIGEICAVLVEEFEVDRSTCEAEVLELVKELLAVSLVRVSAAPAPGPGPADEAV